MTARIIDGKALAREVEAQARARSEALASRPGGRRPGLAVVLVGEDPASCVYVKNKTRACERDFNRIPPPGRYNGKGAARTD